MGSSIDQTSMPADTFLSYGGQGKNIENRILTRMEIIQAGLAEASARRVSTNFIYWNSRFQSSLLSVHHFSVATLLVLLINGEEKDDDRKSFTLLE